MIQLQNTYLSQDIPLKVDIDNAISTRLDNGEVKFGDNTIFNGTYISDEVINTNNIYRDISSNIYPDISGNISSHVSNEFDHRLSVVEELPTITDKNVIYFIKKKIIN